MLFLSLAKLFFTSNNVIHLPQCLFYPPQCHSLPPIIAFCTSRYVIRFLMQCQSLFPTNVILYLTQCHSLPPTMSFFTPRNVILTSHSVICYILKATLYLPPLSQFSYLSLQCLSFLLNHHFLSPLLHCPLPPLSLPFLT
jgi:hypothetical protein